jgi:PGF-CTERM protein
METTETTSPGFGVVLALVALAGAALLAARRQQ